MNGRKKPLIWTWLPASGRNGTPAPSFQAEITAGPETQPPAQEADPRPTNGEEGLQPPMEMAENTGDLITETEQEKTAESSSGPALAEDPAEAEMTVTAEEERVTPVTGPVAPTAAPGGIYYPDMMLARAYIPYQNYGPTYSPREALEKGTLFPALYRPFPY